MLVFISLYNYYIELNLNRFMILPNQIFSVGILSKGKSKAVRQPCRDKTNFNEKTFIATNISIRRGFRTKSLPLSARFPQKSYSF